MYFAKVSSEIDTYPLHLTDEFPKIPTTLSGEGRPGTLWRERKTTDFNMFTLKV